MGLNIVNETIGQYDNLGLQLSYAYRTELGNGQVGTGISLGMYQSSLDGSSLNPANSGDPALPTADAQGSALDLGFGIYYNNEDAYIGLSSSNITEPTIEWENATTQKAGQTLLPNFRILLSSIKCNISQSIYIFKV